MVTSYRQFCPVAKAMEVLDERWTLLVIRELLMGSRHFNELRRGLPKMSPSLLSKRLTALVRAGIVVRTPQGQEVEYALTEAGMELRPLLEGLGAWGVRWVPNLGDPDLDPKLLMWDMHRNVDHDRVPRGRTVVHFRFPDVTGKAGRWWLVIDPGEVDVCDVDPGHDVAITVVARLRRLVEIWRGDLTWADAIRSGEIRVEGNSADRRAFPHWFVLSPFAAVSRAGARPYRPEPQQSESRQPEPMAASPQ
jgi:DNA-binding HxlR family transcriptional regulator